MPIRSFRLACFALFAFCLFGQSTAGRFSGTVTDASAAVVPDVQLTAENAESGQEVQVRSDSPGRLVLYPRPPGVYNIPAAKPGCATLKLEGVTIDVSESILRNTPMALGEVSQGVSVTAEAEAVETDSPAIQSTITRQQIEEL